MYNKVNIIYGFLLFIVTLIWKGRGLIYTLNVSEVLGILLGIMLQLITRWEWLIRSHSSARFHFELSGNSN